MFNFREKATNAYNFVMGIHPEWAGLPRVNPTAQMRYLTQVADMTDFDKEGRNNFRFVDAAFSSFKSAYAATVVLSKTLKFCAFPIKGADVFGNEIDSSWTNLGTTGAIAAFTIFKTTILGVFNLIISPLADRVQNYRNPQVNTAVVVIDVQQTFQDKIGSLAVPGSGPEYVDLVNQLVNKFDAKFRYASQDSHPSDHLSFAANATQLAVNENGEKVDVKPFTNFVLDGQFQTAWPVHGVDNTLKTKAIEQKNSNSQVQTNEMADGLVFDAKNIFKKGGKSHVDSYSAVSSADGRYNTGLYDQLRKDGVKRVVLPGIATNFCVAFSALDLLKRGFEVVLPLDACRGVADDFSPPGMKMADMVKLMQSKGAKIVKTATILDQDFDVQAWNVVPKADYNYNDPTNRISSQEQQ